MTPELSHTWNSEILYPLIYTSLNSSLDCPSQGKFFRDIQSREFFTLATKLKCRAIGITLIRNPCTLFSNSQLNISIFSDDGISTENCPLNRSQIYRVKKFITNQHINQPTNSHSWEALIRLKDRELMASGDWSSLTLLLVLGSRVICWHADTCDLTFDRFLEFLGITCLHK